MKTYLLPILVIIFAGLTVSQDAGDRPTTKPRTEQLLIQLENDWARVDVNGDMSVLQRVLAPDVVSTAIRGEQVSVVTSRKEFIAHYEKEEVVSAVDSDVAVHFFADDLAVVTGIDNTVVRDKGGKENKHQDRFTDTWRKRDGVWQCIAGHATRIQ